jgi:pilus assembly protein FimV
MWRDHLGVPIAHDILAPMKKDWRKVSCGVGIAVALGLIVAAGAGCGSSSKVAGTEGGPCFTNGTCNAPLSCLSNLCVNPASTDGAAGTSGAGGVAGSAGSTGAGGSAAGGHAGGGATDAGADGPACGTFAGLNPDCESCCCSQFSACSKDTTCGTCLSTGGAPVACSSNSAYQSLFACQTTGTCATPCSQL